MGQTHKMEAAVITQDKFHFEGIFTIKAAPMGGNLVLLSPKGIEEVQDILSESKAWLSKWFIDIKSWCQELVSKERFVWVSITGIPPHAWKEEVFKIVVQMFGKFITLDDSTRNKYRFDVGKALISATSAETINRTVTMKINEHLFKIRVVEDIFSSIRCNFNSDKDIPTSCTGQSCDSVSEANSFLQVPETDISDESRAEEEVNEIRRNSN